MRILALISLLLLPSAVWGQANLAPAPPIRSPVNDNQAANKAYVDTAFAARAPLASPMFTGTATIPTLALSGSGSTGPVDGMNVTLLATGAVTRSLADRFADVELNVRSFGPVGATCVAGSDDTAAVNKAVSAAIALGSRGAVVRFPRATCSVSVGPQVPTGKCILFRARAWVPRSCA